MIAKIPHHPNPVSSDAVSSGNLLGRPMLFQITQVGSMEPLWPYALALHINPSSLQEQFTKSKNVVMSRGGFVEFVWPDELDSISADSTTGAFIGPDSGLTSDSANPGYKMRRGAQLTRSFRGRHGTMAWERHTDLLELFRQNGQIFGGTGMPVLRSHIMCMYDRGVYVGWFSTFEVSEAGDLPFQFKLNWEFKVVQTVYRFPGTNHIDFQESQPSGSSVDNTGRTPDGGDAATQRIRNLGNVESKIDSETAEAVNRTDEKPFRYVSSPNRHY